MSNFLFPKAREAFLTGALDWTAGTNTFKAILIDQGVDTPTTADDYLDDIGTGARVGTAVALASRTGTDGAADAADITFTAVTGASCEGLLIYKDTGSEATSLLIAYIDTATGLPITPNGGDIIVVWDNGTNKIFRI